MGNLQQNAYAQATLMDPATSEASYEWAENAGGAPLLDPVVKEVVYENRVFRTAEATLTIGYDPVTGTFFEGGIRAFDSDPGCKPN